MSSFGVEVDWEEEDAGEERQGRKRNVNFTLGGGFPSLAESESDSALVQPLRDRLRFWPQLSILRSLFRSFGSLETFPFSPYSQSRIPALANGQGAPVALLKYHTIVPLLKFVALFSGLRVECAPPERE